MTLDEQYRLKYLARYGIDSDELEVLKAAAHEGDKGASDLLEGLEAEFLLEVASIQRKALNGIFDLRAREAERKKIEKQALAKREKKKRRRTKHS